MHRLLSYILLTMLILLPFTGQAGLLSAEKAVSLQASQASTEDCMMHEMQTMDAQSILLK